MICVTMWRSLLASGAYPISGLLVVGLLTQVALAQNSNKAPTKGSTDFGVPQVRAINEQISKVWKDNNLTPSAPATDGEWCRRVFLDIIGRIPSVDEIEAFT